MRRNPNSRRSGPKWRKKRGKNNPQKAMSWLSPASINKTTSMMLQGESTISSSGTGTAYFAIPFDPSSSGYNFAEWSNIAALYNEIKFVSCQIQLTRYISGTLTSGTPIYIGYRFDLNTAPTTLAQVSQLSSALAWNFLVDTSKSGFTMTARSVGPLNWSPTSTVVTNSYAGCPGSFQIAGFAFNNSTTLAHVRVRSIYLLRGRA